MGDDRGQGRAVYPHAESSDEEQVQHHVDHRGHDQVVQGVTAVAHGLEDARRRIVEDDEDNPVKIDAEIQNGIGQHAFGRAHPDEQAGGEQHARDGGDHAGHQAEGHRGVHGHLHARVVPRAVVARDDHAGPREDTAEQPHHQENQVAGGTHRRQRVASQKIAHHQGIHHVVELLEKVAPEQGQGKLYDVPPDGPLRHERCAFLHACIAGPSVKQVFARGLL